MTIALRALPTLVLLIVLALAVPALRAAQPASGLRAEAIDAAVRATVERYTLPGIAVGVIEDGKIVYARGYGETVAVFLSLLSSWLLWSSAPTLPLPDGAVCAGALAL